MLLVTPLARNETGWERVRGPLHRRASRCGGCVECCAILRPVVRRQPLDRGSMRRFPPIAIAFVVVVLAGLLGSEALARSLRPSDRGETDARSYTGVGAASVHLTDVARGPETTLIVTDVPAGFSLIGFTGIPSVLLTESAFSTAQAPPAVFEVISDVDIAVLRLAFLGDPPTTVYRRPAGALWERWDERLPATLNSLIHVAAPEMLGVQLEADSRVLQGYVPSDERRVLEGAWPAGTFATVVWTGAEAELTTWAVQNPIVRGVWAWDNVRKEWASFFPDLPAVLQGLRTVHPFDPLFLALEGFGSVVIPATPVGGPSCDLVFDALAVRETGGGDAAGGAALRDAVPGSEIVLSGGGRVRIGDHLQAVDVEATIDRLLATVLTDAVVEVFAELGAVNEEVLLCANVG